MITQGDCLQVLRELEPNSFDSLVTDPPAGISFMGKDWDSDKGGSKQWIAWMTEVMQECLRVMKPGAHGLVWAIPRTSHWTATACENAGFEIRDVVTHLFGSGFPKSLDISKAIDKSAGAEREVVGNKDTRSLYDSSNRKDSHKFTGNDYNNGIKGGTSKCQLTAPATDLAKQWDGWGTALKPASEHWILIRKPCSEKTVAKNVEKWGTGGINIDGCRISTTETLSSGRHITPTTVGPSGYRDVNRTEYQQNSQGRFPANLLLSHSLFCTDTECEPGCAVRGLDEQSGPCKTGNIKAGTLQGFGTGKNCYGEGAIPREYKTDSATGASRFFYCAKASRRERGKDNVHPTVKPIKLMQYLIRLITPPNGVVLDPFMGSGSTGVAAKAESLRFMGIEQSKEYCAIAEKRIEAI